jgi:chromosome segregation ATPase
MQTVLRALVLVIFAMSIFLLSFSVMVSYTYRDLQKRNSAIKTENGQLATRLKELTEARQGAKEQDQGIEFWSTELGKAKNANDRVETKDIPAAMEDLNRKLGQDREALEKTEEENIRYGERIVTEKLRAAKDLRTKVEEARVTREKSKKENDDQEKLKRELQNRLIQAEHKLADLKARKESLDRQLSTAKKTTGN